MIRQCILLQGTKKQEICTSNIQTSTFLHTKMYRKGTLQT